MKTIGRYIARGQLGRGGMGRVYKAEMPVTGRIVALKLLKPNPHLVDMMGMDRIREMFIREAVTMAGRSEERRVGKECRSGGPP